MVSVPILLVALGEDASREVRHQLHLEPLHAPSSLWISHGPVHHSLAVLRRHLQTGSVRSAALLPEIPPRDRLWLATEWWGKLVVDEEFAPLIRELESWDIESRNESHRLLILSPGELREKDRTSQVQEVGSPEEYESSLFSDRPVVARLRLADLEDHKAWQQWFGELAEPHVGGAMALLALSGARPDSREVALRNPAALGLAIADHETPALSTYCRRKKLKVSATGHSWGRFEPYDAHTYDFAHQGEEISGQIQAELASAQRDSRGASYFVLLGVEAIEDPEVVIPAGAIFEQSSVNGVQTLAAARPRNFQIDVGQFLPIALPAWCLNRSLSPPAGQPVRPTPLVYPGGASSQGGVWDDIERRLSEGLL